MRLMPDYPQEFAKQLAQLEGHKKEEWECWQFCQAVQQTAPPEYRDSDLIPRFVFTHTLDLRDDVINTGFVFSRQGSGYQRFAFCSKRIIDMGLMGSGTGQGAYCAPMYLFRRHDGKEWYPKDGCQLVEENFNPAFRNFVNDLYNEYFTLKEIVSYVYAVLHNRPYITKFYELLHRDFPRIPFVKDVTIFRMLSDLGTQLIEFHLMNNVPLDYYRLARNASMPALPEGLVFTSKKREHIDRDKCRLYVADGWYIPYVEPAIYDYQVGGYRALRKWLMYRCGDPITLANYLHLLDIIYVIDASLAIEAKINEFDLPAISEHTPPPPPPQESAAPLVTQAQPKSTPKPKPPSLFKLLIEGKRKLRYNYPAFSDAILTPNNRPHTRHSVPRLHPAVPS